MMSCAQCKMRFRSSVESQWDSSTSTFHIYLYMTKESSVAMTDEMTAKLSAKMLFKERLGVNN